MQEAHQKFLTAEIISASKDKANDLV